MFNRQVQMVENIVVNNIQFTLRRLVVEPNPLPDEMKQMMEMPEFVCHAMYECPLGIDFHLHAEGRGNSVHGAINDANDNLNRQLTKFAKPDKRGGSL
jgi:ribosome-associated translation inhibitor RaiA